MAWTEIISGRKATSKLFADGSKRARVIGMSQIHYESQLDSGVFDSEIDLEVRPVNNAQLDGWLVTQNGFHYALGNPKTGLLAGLDGTIGFGGRKGQNWVKYRLFRVGYLHYPTRAWQDIGGAPTYNRAQLSREFFTRTFLDGSQSRVMGRAQWNRIWSTPSGGQINAEWVVRGGDLKENVILNQAGRDWIRNNRPPTTPINETYFGFVYQIDPTGIPRWIKNGILQNIDGDFDDVNGNIEIKDSLDRLLAFMPVSDVWTPGGTRADWRRRLRKRIYKDGSNWFLLVGIRVDDLITLPAGDLIFDPSWSTSISANANDGEQGASGWGLTGYQDHIYVGNESDVNNYAGFSFQAQDDLTSVTSVDKAYFRAFTGGDRDVSPIPVVALRVSTNKSAIWSSSNLPSNASWINARATANFNPVNGIWVFGEGDSYALNLNSDIETLAPDINDWINICAYTDYGGTTNHYIGFQDYNNAGTNEAELYIEWTAGGETPLVADKGDFALSGQATGLLKNNLIGASQGSFVLSGQSVNLNKTFSLPVEKGDFSFTGQSIGFLADKLIEIVQGSFSLTGQDVIMDKVYNIPIEKGDFALSGQAINLLKNFLIQTGQGSFTLTGFDTAFPITELLGIEKGDFVLTGHDIGLFRTFPTAIDKGDFILTGQDINLFTNKLLGINQGSFALSGQTVNFFKSLLLQPAKGDFVLTGYDVGLTETFELILVADKGDFTLTGYETIFLITKLLGIEQADFILSGQNVNFAKNLLLLVSKGDFALTGNTVNLLKNLVLQLQKGNFILTGFDTTLNVMAISDNIVITILETKKYINTKIGIENYIEQLIESKSFVEVKIGTKT